MSDTISNSYAFTTKIPSCYFADIDKLILSLHREAKANIILKRKNEVGELTLPNFETYLSQSYSNQDIVVLVEE